MELTKVHATNSADHLVATLGETLGCGPEEISY